MGTSVDLVEAQDDGPARLAQDVVHVAVARAVSLGHVHQPQDQVHLADALHRRVHHPLVHAVHGLVDARGVEEDELRRPGRFTTARMRLRVVWGLSETMATFWPTSRFTSVDLPTLGRPTTVTNPARKRRRRVGACSAASTPDAASRRKRTRLTRLRSASTTST